ncbi:MAG: ABC transporter permease [Boseongicola sp. SB0677_bin_26]|nr:ABC transporter permease [Boseongicola sp. SB0665_bin_10]MYG26677.1 ABC transporter permease [Boseongicola sp. SB0677_bin_26]
MIDGLTAMLPLAWRNLWRNPRRTGITLIVVAIGVWSILFFNAFMIAWAKSSKETTLQLLLGSGQIHAEGYMDDPSIETLMDPPDQVLTLALDAPAVADWTTRVVVPGVIQSEYKTLPATIVGVGPAAEARISSLPGKIVEGRYLNGSDDDSAVLGLHMVERLKTGLGRRVILMSQNTDGAMSEQSFDVVGIYDADKATEDLYVFTGRAASQEFLGLEDEIAQVVFVLREEMALEDTVAALADAAPDLDVRSWKDLNLFLASMDSFMSVFIHVWLGIVFALMAIGIVNTQLMAVFERTQEFGLLRALGMKPRRVLLMVTIENALLIGVGVLAGMVLAAVTIWSVSDGIDFSAFARAMEMVQTGEVIYLDYEPEAFILFPGLIWLLGILVALWPARRAAKCRPVEAMRRET